MFLASSLFSPTARWTVNGEMYAKRTFNQVIHPLIAYLPADDRRGVSVLYVEGVYSRRIQIPETALLPISRKAGTMHELLSHEVDRIPTCTLPLISKRSNKASPRPDQAPMPRKLRIWCTVVQQKTVKTPPANWLPGLRG